MNIILSLFLSITLAVEITGAMEREHLRQVDEHDTRLVFNKANFAHFLTKLNSTWTQEKLSKVSSLTFNCEIDISAGEDMSELSDSIWEDKYIFSNKHKKEVNEIIRSAANVRELHFYNIPSLEIYLDNLLNSGAVTSFSYNYDTRIFDASICLKHIAGCLQFTNLKYLCLHSGVFAFCNEDEIADFFSHFPTVQDLNLLEVMKDSGSQKYTTNLMKALKRLKALKTLTVSFFEPPNMHTTQILSALGLSNLRIIWQDGH